MPRIKRARWGGRRLSARRNLTHLDTSTEQNKEGTPVMSTTTTRTPDPPTSQQIQPDASKPAGQEPPPVPMAPPGGTSPTAAHHPSKSENGAAHVLPTPLSGLSDLDKHSAALDAINSALRRVRYARHVARCRQCSDYRTGLLVCRMDVSGSTADALVRNVIQMEMRSSDPCGPFLTRVAPRRIATTFAFENGTMIHPPRTVVHEIGDIKELKPNEGHFISGSSEKTDELSFVQIPIFNADTDLMLEIAIHVVLQTPEEYSSQPFPAGLHADCVAMPSTASMGYYRILHIPKSRCSHSAPLALPAARVRHALANAVRAVVGDVGTVSLHGPAVTFTEGTAESDLVACVRVVWPEQWWEEMRRRRRPAGWPGTQLLDMLDRHIHLVPVGPCEGELDLWRLSFSAAEAALTRELPPDALSCLVGLRQRRVLVKTADSLLSSYHLKTAVFWVCEHRAAEQWQDAEASMYTVVDWLGWAVTRKHLPCFFLPEVNALRNPTEKRLQQLHVDVERLKEIVRVPVVLPTLNMKQLRY